MIRTIKIIAWKNVETVFIISPSLILMDRAFLSSLAGGYFYCKEEENYEGSVIQDLSVLSLTSRSFVAFLSCNPI